MYKKANFSSYRACCNNFIKLKKKKSIPWIWQKICHGLKIVAICIMRTIHRWEEKIEIGQRIEGCHWKFNWSYWKFEKKWCSGCIKLIPTREIFSAIL